MSSVRRTSLILSLGLLTAIATSGARADDDELAKFSNPAMQNYAALAKIESNLGEAASQVYLHAALPAKHEAREDLAKGFQSDVKTIEANIVRIDAAKLTGKAADDFAAFKTGWGKAKGLSEALLSASAEAPADPAALIAHAKAYDDLDDSIDDALEAVAEDAKL